MSETTDGASKVGLGNEQTLDLSSEDWYDFDDSSSDETDASSSDSKSNQETGMDINAIQMVISLVLLELGRMVKG